MNLFKNGNNVKCEMNVIFLAPFSSHYFVFLCSWFCLSGLGYVLSLIMTPRNSQMAAIVTVVIMALLSG